MITGALEPEEASRLVTEAFADEADSATLVADAMEYITRASNEAAAAQADLADETLMTAEEAQQKLQPIIDKIENLSKAYKEAYDAAYQSISGQFDLFEEMSIAQASKDPIETVNGYKAALDSQAAYLEDYYANWEKMKNDGLAEGLLQQLSDGSKESAQILADLVAGGSDKIDELNQAFGSVEEGKKKFADSIAEMQTKFSENMTKYKAELDSAVSAMDKSGEAASYGSAVVSSFAAAAAGKVGEVAAAFEALSAAATIKASMSLSIGGLTGGLSGKVGAALSGGLGAILGRFGFASGTPSAPPGYAIVGEEGPELVRLRGGERIYNADETAQAVSAMASGSASGNSYHVDIHNQYDINGSANADELRSIIEQNNRNLPGMIEDALNDIENDKRRRAYA